MDFISDSLCWIASSLLTSFVARRPLLRWTSASLCATRNFIPDLSSLFRTCCVQSLNFKFLITMSRSRTTRAHQGDNSDDTKTDFNSNTLYGRDVQTDKARTIHVKKIDKIIARCLKKEIRLEKDSEYLDAITTLFSREFLVAVVEGMGESGRGIKRVIVQRLLERNWIVPSSVEIAVDDYQRAIRRRQDAYDIHDLRYRQAEGKVPVQDTEESSGQPRPQPEGLNISRRPSSTDFAGISELLARSMQQGPNPPGNTGQRDQPPAGQLPARQPPIGQPPVGQLPAGQPPAGLPPVGQPIVGPVSSIETFFRSLIEQTQVSTMLQREMLEQQIARRTEIEHPGALSRTFTNAIYDGKYADLTQLWDRDIAAVRPGGSERKAKPSLVSDMAWDDWILAMINLSNMYADAGCANIAVQVTNLLHAAMIQSAVTTRASVMAACEDIRRSSTSRNCRWGLHSMQTGKAPIIMRQFIPNPRPSYNHNGKRKFPPQTSYFPNGNNFPSRNISSSGSNSSRPRYTVNLPRRHNEEKKHFTPYGSSKPCFHWLSGKECMFKPCRFQHHCSLCGEPEYHDTSKCPIQQARRHR